MTYDLDPAPKKRGRPWLIIGGIIAAIVFGPYLFAGCDDGCPDRYFAADDGQCYRDR